MFVCLTHLFEQEDLAIHEPAFNIAMDVDGDDTDIYGQVDLKRMCSLHRHTYGYTGGVG